jgi:hypothetical protein
MTPSVETTEKGPLDGPFLDTFHLAILIPSMDHWDNKFALSLLQVVATLHQHPIAKEQTYFIINHSGSMLTMNREGMVLAALKSDPKITHILFLDSDMTFPADTVHWLVHRNEPIVIANYNRRTIPTYPVTRGLDSRFLATLDSSTGLQPIKCGGLGVAMFKREVFDKVPRPWFHFEWYPDPQKAGEFLMNGEDTWLFKRAQKAGYQVLVDHDLSKQVTHVGQFEYTYRMAFIEEDESYIGPDGSYDIDAKIKQMDEAYGKSAA